MAAFARALVGFVCTALAAELLLHALPVSTGYSFMGVTRADSVLRGTPYANYVYSKNWNFRLHNAGRLNNFGFRASRDYQPDSRALLVVGNSFVVADAIQPYDNMTEQLGRLLNRPTDAIGADGGSLADYLAAVNWAGATLWPAAAADTRTALVLLTTSDLDHSCLPHAGGHYLQRQAGQISLALVPKAPPSWLKRRLNDSMLFRYVFDNLAAPANWRRAHAEADATPGAVRSHPVRTGCAAAGAVPEATGFLLSAFHDFERRERARVIFIVAPGYRAEQGYAPWEARDIDGFARQAASSGFQVVSLDDAFASALHAGTRLDFSPIDAHWNTTANAIAARIIAAALSIQPERGVSVSGF